MDTGKILVSQTEGDFVIKFEGDVRLTLCAPLNQYIETIFSSDKVNDVIVDMLDATGVDSTTLGLMAKLAMYCNEQLGITPTLFCTDPSLAQIVESMGLDDLFDMVDQTPDQLEDMQELKDLEEDIEQIKQHIIEAHKLLQILKPDNSNEFMDLIASLEKS